MATEETVRSVELSEDVLERVEARLSRTEWDEVDEYVEFVLEEVLTQVETTTEDGTVDAVDESEVKGRLESLGYLNE
jgi:predicted aldo/keto reductase-like oxidoreductase